jgi:diguanylate cyclase (GGDEF)-like protein
VRYFLGFPACGISALAVYLLSEDKGTKNLLSSKWSGSLKVVAAGFAAYGVFTGLIVPDADIYAARHINYTAFIDVFKMPVQVLRCLAAAVISAYLARAVPLSLRVKFQFYSGVIITLLVALMISHIIGSSKIKHLAGQSLILIEEGKAIQDMGISLESMDRYMRYESYTDINKYLQLKESFDKAAHQYLGIHCEFRMDPDNNSEIALIRKIHRVYMKYTDAFEKKMSHKKLEILYYDLKNTIDNLLAIHVNEGETIQKKVMAILSSTMNSEIAGLFGFALFFLLSSYILGRIFIGPIHSLKNGIEALKNGHYDNRIELRSGDEFQDFAEEYNEMAIAITERNNTLEKARREMELLSITDQMTGLYNNRYFNSALKKEIRRSARHHDPLVLIIVDIDHFKNINDAYGHPVGDEVLSALGDIFREALRKIDIPCRYGGEEFALILPSTEKPHAMEIAERLRKTVEFARFPFMNTSFDEGITISLGVACYPLDASSEHELIVKADNALYKSKSDGRNMVTAC